MPDAEAPFWAHWYELAGFADLRQGDILRGLTTLWFPKDLIVDEEAVAEGNDLETRPAYKKGDWIVFTASCDMENNSDCQVLLGRLIEANQANLKAQTEAQFSERLEVIRRGQYPTRFLLPEFSAAGFAFPRSVVDFHFHVLMPIQYLLRVAASPRLRMQSPLRELFGNWVGACFSRVGVETKMQIPRVVERLYDKQVLRATAEDAPRGPVDERLPKIEYPSREKPGGS